MEPLALDDGLSEPINPRLHGAGDEVVGHASDGIRQRPESQLRNGKRELLGMAMRDRHPALPLRLPEVHRGTASDMPMHDGMLGMTREEVAALVAIRRIVHHLEARQPAKHLASQILDLFVVVAHALFVNQEIELHLRSIDGAVQVH